VFSCKKEEIKPEKKPVKIDTITKVVTDLKFKLYPTANDQFTISILSQENKSYTLYINHNNQKLANFDFTNSNVLGIMNAEVKFNFSATDTYDIQIRSTRQSGDTVFYDDFFIYSYNHQYSNRFTYDKLASINQKLDFDISPSRNVIYYIDYINNKFVLKKLTLADKKLEVIDPEFFSLFMRAKSDNELIVSSRNYDNRYLGYDSCAVLTYDTNTKTSNFIDWGSADYGRFSRVVNNCIAISNPVQSNSITLINFTSGIKKSFQTDIRYLREYNYDHIYLNNNIYDITASYFMGKLTFLNSNTNMVYYDENSQFIIAVEYFQAPDSWETYSRMLIYKDNFLVYEQAFEKGRYLNFPSLINLKDQKLIFGQIYEYSSSVRIDGYYLLNIATKKIEFLQNDDNNSVINDFFIYDDKNSFIPIRPYEIYKIAVK